MVGDSTAGATDLTILPGAGGGRFGPPRVRTADATPRGVATADFDEDGLSDIAVTAGAAVTILQSNGLGSFAATRTAAPAPAGSSRASTAPTSAPVPHP